LTGGIGSGKSTVGHLLVERGAALIDADVIARSVTEPHGLAMSAISDTFGPTFVNADGSLDRAHMRAHVFKHPEAKRILENIIHPLVAEEIHRLALAATDAGRPTLVFDIPLLVEAGSRWRAQVDRILVIDCSPETQIQRVVARNALTREMVVQIIATQASRLQRLSAADWVIHNDGLSLDGLRESVFALP
jgi:dephospho-CoA kinase